MYMHIPGFPEQFRRTLLLTRDGQGFAVRSDPKVGG